MHCCASERFVRWPRQVLDSGFQEEVWEALIEVFDTLGNHPLDNALDHRTFEPVEVVRLPHDGLIRERVRGHDLPKDLDLERVCIGGL